MSMTRREVEEEEQAQMLMRAITGNNVKKIEAVLEKTKRHGKGFVLTSQYARPRPRKSSPKNTQKSAEPHLPMVVGSPIGSPSPTRKSTPLPEKLSPPPTRSKSAGRRQKRSAKSNRPSSQPTYLTEFQLKPTKVDMAVQSDDIDTIMKIPEPPPTTPEQRSESGELEANRLTREKQTSPLSDLKRKTSQEKLEPAKDLHSFTDMTREEPVGQENNDKRRKNKKKQNRIRDADFARLGLSKRPPQFKTKPKLPPSSIDKDPQNPEPMRPNIWLTRVPKEGGDVKTPFYLQVDIPDGALRGDVIMKFETQAYEKTKLSLSETDKLCSYVVDVNMNPMTYNLHQEATVRLRILEECINKHEDAYVVSARHFNWNRIPTEIEVKEVNGDRHFYAVAKTQYLGKFAVITSPRLDRFVMTSAGGTFPSTILPHVSVNLEEGSVKDIAHIVEMSVAQSRQEAVTKTSLECQNITDVPGQLVASSPIVEVSKEIMGRSGLLPDGSTLPAKVRVNMPVTTALKTPGMSDNDSKNPWKKPTVKIMQRAKMAWGDEYGRKGSVLPGFWEDITAEQKLLLHPVSIQNGDAVGVSADVPGQFLVLVFDENSQKATGSSKELSEVCESLLLNNNTFNAVLMVHQRVAKPEIISVHVVPEAAASLISSAMEKKGEWKPTDLNSPNKKIRMKERDFLDLVFRDGLKLTTNQMEPEVQFNSRRWQGYQFQLEATDESYTNCDEAVIKGAIDFCTRSTGEDMERLHTCHLTIPKESAKPYKPTVVVRPTPTVTVFREYKLKWLKSLSAAEQEKYQAINSP